MFKYVYNTRKFFVQLFLICLQCFPFHYTLYKTHPHAHTRSIYRLQCIVYNRILCFDNHNQRMVSVMLIVQCNTRTGYPHLIKDKCTNCVYIGYISL